MDVLTIQENIQQLKVGEDLPCRYSMSTIWTFDNI